MRILFCAMCLALATSCGGGGGGHSSAIEGRWEGDLLNTPETCSDGTGTGGGSGIVLRRLELDVSGSDVVNSVVHANDGSCAFEGTRLEDGFRAAPVGDCDPTVKSIRFVLTTEGAAAFNYHHEFARTDDPDIICGYNPAAELFR